MIVDNFRDLRVFGGSYRRRCIVGLVIEAQYRKIIVVPFGFDDYLVSLHVAEYQHLLPVPQTELVDFLVAQELTFQALVIELSANSLHMMIGYAFKRM